MSILTEVQMKKQVSRFAAAWILYYPALDVITNSGFIASIDI